MALPLLLRFTTIASILAVTVRHRQLEATGDLIALLRGAGPPSRPRLHLDLHIASIPTSPPSRCCVAPDLRATAGPLRRRSHRHTPPSTSSATSSRSWTPSTSRCRQVVGSSGAGKSTLVDILATRTTPTQGRLLLNGAPLRSTSKSGYARSLAPDPATMFGDSDGSKDASAAAPGPTRRSRPSPTYFCRRHRRSCYCCGSRWKGGEAPEGEKEVEDADGNSFKS